MMLREPEGIMGLNWYHRDNDRDNDFGSLKSLKIEWGHLMTFKK